MNIAIVIDDPSRVDFAIENWLKDVTPLENFLGMDGCDGFYKDKKITLLYFNSDKDSVSLRTEDLFSFRDFDFLMNIGYCYTLDNSVVAPGSLALISHAKCDLDYRDLLSIENYNGKAKEADQKLTKRLLDFSKKLDCPLGAYHCFSAVSHFSKDSIEGKPLAPLVDLKAYALYETSASHNRSAICLYYVRDIDLNAPINREEINDGLDRLTLLALEFSAKLNVNN